MNTLDINNWDDYLRDIGHIEPLKREEETKLAVCIHDDNGKDEAMENYKKG